MEQMNYDAIVKHLKKTTDKDDKEMFKKWSMGYISTEKAITYFCRTNRVPERERGKIQPHNFEPWLNSLGYHRKSERLCDD